MAPFSSPPSSTRVLPEKPWTKRTGTEEAGLPSGNPGYLPQSTSMQQREAMQ
jgi:hypothetical protein